MRTVTQLKLNLVETKWASKNVVMSQLPLSYAKHYFIFYLLAIVQLTLPAATHVQSHIIPSLGRSYVSPRRYVRRLVVS